MICLSQYSQTSFYCASLYCPLQILCVLQIEGLWQPASSKSIGTIFQQHFLTVRLCQILVILAVF